MKENVPYLVLLLGICTCFGSIFDDPETADGYLTAGEYAFGVSLESEEKLVVDGGGQIG